MGGADVALLAGRHRAPWHRRGNDRARHGGPPGSTAKAVGLAAVALALFALGANTAWRHWMGVIAEQQLAEYEVQIAYGLPIVTYAGALGAVVCALLILTLLAIKWRGRTTSSQRGEPSPA